MAKQTGGGSYMGRGTDFHKFPTFSLEDKTLLDERGSDRKGQWHMEEKHDQPSWKVYSRRKKKGHVEE